MVYFLAIPVVIIFIFVLILAKVNGNFSEIGSYLKHNKFIFIQIIGVVCICFYYRFCDVNSFNKIYHHAILLGNYEIKASKGIVKIEIGNGNTFYFYPENMLDVAVRDYVMTDDFKIYKNADSDTLYLCKGDIKYHCIISKP